MYRIEVAPGEESVFRTLEELAVAIRNGVVTPRARIYHHASQKWLPIALHPHYKKAMEMQVGTAAHPPAALSGPLSALARLKSRIEPHASPRSAPQAPPRPEPQAAAPHPEPVPPTVAAPATAHAAWSAPTREPGPESEQKPAPKLEPKAEPKPEPKPEPKFEPKAIAEGRPGADFWPEPKPHAIAKVPPPVTSPVLAMQQEVLRDLPVVAIPEPRPLPWAPPAPRVAALPPAPAPLAGPPAPVRAAPAPPVIAARPAEPRHVALDELVAPRPAARRSRRPTGRPLLLLGAASALVIGAHLVLTATSSPSASTADSASPAEPAERPAASEHTRPAPVEPSRPAPSTGVTASSRVTTEPARVLMTPGPAFAGSAPARLGDPTDAPQTTAKPAVPKATSTPAAAASLPPDSAPPIAPAPAAPELALPVLPSDSIVPTTGSGDTMGMKRILRALNGGAPAKRSPAR